MSALSTGFHVHRENYIVIEQNCAYVYCAICGGLKFPHLFAAEHPNQSVQITALWPACLCQSTNEKIKIAIQHVLQDIYQQSGNCSDVEEVRQLLLRVASREEMRR